MYSPSIQPTSLALGRPSALIREGAEKGRTVSRHLFSPAKTLIYSWLTMFQESYTDKMPDKDEVRFGNLYALTLFPSFNYLPTLNGRMSLKFFNKTVLFMSIFRKQRLGCS